MRLNPATFIFFALLLAGLFAGCSRSHHDATDTEDTYTDTTYTDTGTGHDTNTEGDTETESPSETVSDSASVVDSDTFLPLNGILINEVMSKNEGAVLDDALETEDWIELINSGDAPELLSNYTIADSSDRPVLLPQWILAPGELVLLFADNDDQGESHLPFKISASGDSVTIATISGVVIDSVDVPALDPNVSYMRLSKSGSEFAPCRYATPKRPNDDCAPPVPQNPVVQQFAPFDWPTPFFEVPGPLVLNELSLRPAAFIEIVNSGDTDVDVSAYALRLAPNWPGEPWPGREDGAVIPATGVLAPGERMQIAVDDTMTAVLESDLEFEGVVTIFNTADDSVSDRVDFMSWPQNGILSRIPDATGMPVYCANATPDAVNTCTPLKSRPVGNRLRYLRTPGDFEALAEGGAELGIGSVKFVMDLDVPGAVHLLSSGFWDLHYTFVRELVEGNDHLDRCDPEDTTLFNQGWYDFSVENYYSEDRRFILGTLSHHGGADLRCVEYTFGDAISPAQMVQGFFGATAHTMNPAAWYLRPQDASQVSKALLVEGQAPMVGTDAPFAGVTYQPLTEAVGYGILTWIDTNNLATAQLGPQTIVVTSDVPNDIPLVGGLITQAFQTPLAHVNLLSQARGTPNMALRDASSHEDITAHLGELVRLKVDATHFEITPADPLEAQAFWDALLPDGPKIEAQRDGSITGLVNLDGRVGFEDLGAIGAKAAQLSELFRITATHARCQNTLTAALPPQAFAIPVAYYLAHFENCGASALWEQYQALDEFQTDRSVRIEAVTAVREAIAKAAVDPALLSLVEAAVAERFGSEPVRFRSSSNTEDLSAFNGAGLYTSASGQLGSTEESIDRAILTVWASLWNQRAYDERELANIDHNTVAMGIMVHQAYLSEEANGVAVSRDITEPNRGDRYYVNVQAGEATVTNPAPGVTSEEFIYQWPSRMPTLRERSTSSLSDGYVLNRVPVSESMTPLYGEVEGEIRDLMCALWSIHDHFETVLNPDGENPWFAMEVEFKLVHETRALAIKQARPFSFGGATMPTDCREL
ncbi:MAG: lamin tail domain-containing protein [Deltaproteobacteria bacterium]|nr:lamin tail domain-containing protein [Deltaproteobacteria bacterium]